MRVIVTSIKMSNMFVPSLLRIWSHLKKVFVQILDFSAPPALAWFGPIFDTALLHFLSFVCTSFLISIHPFVRSPGKSWYSNNYLM